ncbi:MAG: DoxX family protein [Polyangiaceae bacterium]|nr:DoxX family protein [Polyangiaceae bacterium]
MSRLTAAGWHALSGLLTLQLGIVGTMQIVGAEPIRSNIAEMGYPAWFRVVLGLAQLAGVVGLWTRRFRFAAALGLAVILGGAVVSHVRFGHDAEHTMPAVVTLGLLAVLAWARRPRRDAVHLQAPEPPP